MSYPDTHKNGIGMVKTSKKSVKKKLQLLLTVILKHPVLTSAVTEVNQQKYVKVSLTLQNLELKS